MKIIRCSEMNVVIIRCLAKRQRQALAFAPFKTKNPKVSEGKENGCVTSFELNAGRVLSSTISRTCPFKSTCLQKKKKNKSSSKSIIGCSHKNCYTNADWYNYYYRVSLSQKSYSWQKTSKNKRTRLMWRTILQLGGEEGTIATSLYLKKRY